MTTTTPAATRTGCCACPQPCAHDECCALDCLVRPRFFGGQLLTDADLDQLVTWAADKFRLGRYRHGWGIVCGLEVRCDPADPAGVIVSPGYAVSCCGEDIIVCEDTKLDLSGACPKQDDPCADIGRPTPASPAAADAPKGIPPWPTEPLIVDVTLAYATTPTDPTTPLTRTACGQRTGCEYGRVRETSAVTWTAGVAGTDPIMVAAQRWLDGYHRCSEVLRKFRETFTSYQGRGEEIRRWLRRWIGSHPLTGFCFLADTLATMSADTLADELKLAEILFWLVQDCRNAYLTCTCFACGAGTGVPLARVWLRPSPSGNGGCPVFEIDAYPPYRRPLGQQCWPAPPGKVNGGRVIWHRWEDACVTLAELGVATSHREEFTFPRTLAGLADVLSRSPFLDCGEPATPQILNAGLLGHRLIGFWKTPNDDLTRISGIGSSRAEQLRDRGIRGYRDFAEAPASVLRHVFPPTVREDALDAMRKRARELADE